MAGPSLMATLGANIAPFLTNLEQAKTSAKSEGESIASALGEELGGKLGTLLGAAGIEETIRQTVEFGSHVQDLANRLGISTDAVQQWDYALKQNGSTIDEAVGFFEKLGIAREKALSGNEKNIEAFQKLGVSIEQLRTLRVEDVAAVIAKGFQLGDPQELIASLREVGGRGAGQMAAAFRAGLADELKEAPLINADDIANLKEAEDAWAKLKAEFRSDIAPIVASVTEAALSIIDFAKSALAVPVGALKGLVESFPGFSNPGALLKWWAGGNLISMFEGSKEALDAVSQQKYAADKAEAEKRDRLSRPFTGTFEGESSEGGRGKHGQISGDEEWIQEILKAERERDQEQGDAYTSAAKDLAELQKEEKKFSERRMADYEVNSLQKIGGVLGSFTDTNEIAMVEVQKKSEEHLADIRKEIHRLTEILSHGPSDDTQF